MQQCRQAAPPCAAATPVRAQGKWGQACVAPAACLTRALRLLHPRASGWQVPVETCSALEGGGIARAWEHIENFRASATASGEFATRRASQARAWLWGEMTQILSDALRADPVMQRRVAELEAAVAAGQASPRVAAQELVGNFLREPKPG